MCPCNQPTGLGSSTLSQDFEIAGSRSAVLDDCQTPGSIISARSWDSHANYRPPDGSAGGSSGSLYSDIVLYWDEWAILSIQGLLRILLVVCKHIGQKYYILYLYYTFFLGDELIDIKQRIQ